MAFQIDRFIDDCRNAVAGDPTHLAARAGVETLYHAPDLTVLNVVWGPLMSVPPHDHDMWAVIGVYGGREDNIFWRRIDAENGPVVEAAGAKSLGAADTEPLGRDIVHSVLNPTGRLTAAIHVYGGDFFGVDRHEWDPETHRRRAYDFEGIKRRFAESNRLLD